MSLRFRICLVAWIAVVAISQIAKADVHEFEDGWQMQITPAAKLPAAPDAAPEDTADVSRYSKIYRQVPFNRAEYNANPSYRHDSTMEILTGNARHQTILHHSTAPAPRTSRPAPVIPYRYNNLYRGLNYYFYFPYWNYRGIY